MRKHTTTKKCGCKFEIVLVQVPDKTWGIVPIYGKHNHPLFDRPEGHRRLSELDSDQTSYLTEQKLQHISPSKMLVGLARKFPNRVMPSLRMIYNFTEKLNAEVRGTRNPAQHMIHLAREANYVFFIEEDPVTKCLTRIFMAHPDAVKMFRAWPHVGVVDSTYRTNRYAMPLVEIVGVSPVGLNFVVAYVLLMDEKSDSYAWVLERLRDLLVDGSLDVFVTDRELGLIKAVKEIFPLSAHLLCVWHIYNAVEGRALQCFKRGMADYAKLFSRFYFRDMVQATSFETFQVAWTRMRECFYEKANLLSYVSKTWNKCVECWSRFHTNNVFHLGNTSTGRAESAHSLMKTWLGTSTHGLDTFWSKAHDMIKGQHRDIRIKLNESRSRGFGFSAHYGNLFSLLRGKVSKHGIILMREEFDRGVELGEALADECGCALVTTHGLLCACKLHQLRNGRRNVHVENIHSFWSKLSYEVVDLNDPAPNDDLESMFDTIRSYDVATQRVVMETLNTHIHPEEGDFLEPHVVENTRGRPRTSTTRNLSLIDHLRTRYPGTSSSIHATSSTSTATIPATQPHASSTIPVTRPHFSSTIPVRQPRDVPVRVSFDVDVHAPLQRDFMRCRLESFGERDLIPAVINEYFDAYYDPRGDGHCGFRCMASAVLGDENEWSAMRVALLAEIQRPVYDGVYVLEDLEPVSRITCPPHRDIVGPAHWMVGVDLFGFATINNWAICCISISRYNNMTQWTGSSTYLPLRAPPGVDAPYGVLWLLHTGSHYLRLRFHDQPPMPTINFLWAGRADDSVRDWDRLYATRTRVWRGFFTRDTAHVDVSDEDD